jgi:hypothetical protein
MKKKYAEFLIPKARISLEDILLEMDRHWCLVCYLIINWRIDQLRERAGIEIPTSAYKVLAEHLYNYVYEDVMPPEAIASTVLNVADDFVRGEPVKLRAGDYIALQGFARDM